MSIIYPIGNNAPYSDELINGLVINETRPALIK